MSKLVMEHIPFLSIVAMSANGARQMVGEPIFKVQCVGQADANRYKFGARRYRVFKSAADWNRYRWFGSSNGYYSEEVDFVEEK